MYTSSALLCWLGIALISSLACPTFAGSPRYLTHQGRVAVDGVNFTGAGRFKFVLYQDDNQPGGGVSPTALWNNAASVPASMSEPATFVSLTVNRGLYSVALGDSIVPGMALLPDSIAPASGLRLFLRVWFSDNVHGFQQLAPDQELTAVPFALHVGSDAVDNAALADDAVSASKIGNLMLNSQFALGSAVTGGVVQVSFSQPFFEIPTVTLGAFGLTATSITTNGFTVSIPPRQIIIDTTHNTLGQELSMALVGANPAVAYYDGTSGDLRYVRATSSSGQLWGTPVVAVVGGASLVGRYPSLAVVNGRPAVAYFDDTADDLKYVRANDSLGTTWGPPVTVASAGIVGEWAQMVVANGRPLIACYNRTDGRLDVFRANDADGATWGAAIPVDGISPADDAGRFVSLVLLTNTPAIAYQHVTSNALHYVKALNLDGTSWDTPRAVVQGVEARECSLALISSRPAVAYVHQGVTLAFKRAGDIAGTSWGNSPSFLAGMRDIRAGISLRVINGEPGVAYWHGDLGDVRYVRAADSIANSWRQPQTIVSGLTGTSPGSVALLDVAGNPGIAYFAGSSRGLGYTTGIELDLSYTARTSVPLEATRVADGSITRDSLAANFFGSGLAERNDCLAVGQVTRALGEASWAGGSRSLASGRFSFAFGSDAQAIGNDACAIGDGAVALEYGSMAFGLGLISDFSAQTVVGRYNQPGISSALFVVGNGNSAGSRENALWVNANGDLEITGAGRKPGGGSWTTPSDARLKDLTGKFTRGLESLDGIQPIQYRYRVNNPVHAPSDSEHVGVVAQEVERTIPEAVSHDANGYAMVNNDPIIWTMLNAIKELKGELDTSRRELLQLRRELDDLKSARSIPHPSKPAPTPARP